MKDVARENGTTFDPDREDNRHRLNMAVFPAGAEIIPNPYNKIAGFAVRSGEGGVFFVPGFPVMAWPMIEWVLDTHFRHLHVAPSTQERSVIVFGAMEAALTPLMEAIEREFAGIKVFSLPSVDHPDWGRHIELGVKGDPALARGSVRPAARRPRACGGQARPRIGALEPGQRTIAVRRRAPERRPRPGRHWHAFC